MALLRLAVRAGEGRVTAKPPGAPAFSEPSGCSSALLTPSTDTKLPPAAAEAGPTASRRAELACCDRYGLSEEEPMNSPR
jgi:hypothetical protein